MALYTAVATSIGGRNGHTRSDDGVIDLDVSIPKSMGGEGKPHATNPEQLFASGYSACFGSAILVVARMKNLKPEEAKITAHVSIDKTPEGGFGLAVTLTGSFKGLTREEAHTLMEEAHKICPYSNATRNNIPVSLEVSSSD